MKIDANDDLSEIDFENAAEKMNQISRSNLESLLQNNLRQAKMNSPMDFARAFIANINS